MNTFASGRSVSTYISQATVDKLILDYVLHSSEPFRTVEIPSFRALIAGLRPERSCMSRNTLVSRINTRFSEWKLNFINELKFVKAVCTTADCWSSHNRSYIGFTIHWIESETLARQSRALACRRLRGSHNYDVIAAIMEKVFMEFHVQNKVVKTVTDNGTNFCKAFKIFGNEVDGTAALHSAQEAQSQAASESQAEDDINECEPVPIFDTLSENDRLIAQTYSLPPHHRCSSHTLNLIATKDALGAEKDAAYKKISRSTFGKCQALWNKQSRSPLAADTVKDICDIYLVLPNATRWNSHYDACARLVKIGENKLLLLSDALGVQNFRPQEIQFLIEYCHVMEPVAQVLDILQSESKMYMGYLLPTISTLKTRLYAMQNGTEVKNLRFCVPLAKSLLAGVETRFDALLEDKNLLIASLLHPKFKLHWLSEEPAKVRAKEILRLAVENFKINQQHQETEEPTFNAPVVKNEIIEDDDDGFFKFHSGSQKAVFAHNRVDEMDRYLAHTNSTLLSLKNFPFMETMFMHYNTAIPSSAPVERLFSAGGGIMVPNRARLSDDNFEKQLILNVNKF
jgi:hypothetical protein